MQIKENSIVLAPYKDNMWPGRVVALGRMADIKLYKINQTHKVPISSLSPLNKTNIEIHRNNNKSKLYTNAIKTAESELKKQQRRTSKESARSIVKSPLKSEKNELNQTLISAKRQSDCKALKIEQPCKTDPEESKEYQHLPQYGSLLYLLLDLNETDLIQTANANPNKKCQFVFYSTATQQNTRYLVNPMLELIKITEYMLARLLCEPDSKVIQIYQRKITTILSLTEFDHLAIIERDILKLIRIVTEYHMCSMMHWKNQKFIDQLSKFKQKASIILDNYLNDYSQIGPVLDLIADFSLSSDDQNNSQNNKQQ